MIVRVLRPVTSKPKAGTPLEEITPKIEASVVVDEAADANAIEVLYMTLFMWGGLYGEVIKLSDL